MSSDPIRPRPIIIDYYVADIIADALPRRSTRGTVGAIPALRRWLHRLVQRIRHPTR
jgi:hypothetical protein